MIKRFLRELYMLPRGEQRAMVLLSLLLILSLIARITVQLLPDKIPPGMKVFEEESCAIWATIQRMDSIKGRKIQNPDNLFQGPSKNTFHSRTGVPGSSFSVPPINLNTADSVMLLPLPGIGPVFAGRIVKYRNLLGGFVCVDQLKEVYGMPEETLDLIRERIIIDSASIRKICLNSASFGELLRHPYLEFEDVIALVKYRDFALQIGSLQELRDNHLLSDSTFKKVSPYIQFKH